MLQTAQEVTAVLAGELAVCRESRLDSDGWWVEVDAESPRKGRQVRDRASADAAVAAGADFLIVAHDEAAAVLDGSAIPIFVIAPATTTLASLRSRGAHGRAEVRPEVQP